MFIYLCMLFIWKTVHVSEKSIFEVGKTCFLSLQWHAANLFSQKKAYFEYPSRWPILQSSLTVRLTGANPSNMVSDVSFFNLFQWWFEYTWSILYQEIQEWLYLFLHSACDHLDVIHVGWKDWPPREFYDYIGAWRFNLSLLYYYW